jgi:hypothetical protein
MGLERVMASSKLDREAAEFVDGWIRKLKPYEASQSSLINLGLRILGRLEATGKISLEPQALQELLGTESRPGTPVRKA